MARRILVLWAVTLLADGGPRDAALAIIDRHQLWPALSPEERDFLEADSVDPEKALELKWRLEALWVLLWAIGDVPELGWPAGECDVAWMVERLRLHEVETDFVTQAQVRSKSEVLDACQLIMLIHWAITESWIHHRPVPQDLDWSSSSPMVAAAACAAVGVVEQRHHALNWLTCFEDAAWDDVQTPT